MENIEKCENKWIKRLFCKHEYKYNLQYYGDYIIRRECSILYEECDDFSDSAYYSLGYFDDNGEFQAMWTWLEEGNKMLWYKGE